MTGGCARRHSGNILPPMLRFAILYAVALALIAAGLQWLQVNYLVRAFSTELYIGLVAIVFIAIGIWAGAQLTRKAPAGPFQRNDAAIHSLGLTPRECEILGLLASGQSNKELARTLGISPNTVKTHIARVFEKLGVDGRIPAIEKARFLAIIA